MSYKSLAECLQDLKSMVSLSVLKKKLTPTLKWRPFTSVHEAGGPALLFENVRDSTCRAAFNIIGTLERSEFIFLNTLKTVQQLIELKDDPVKTIKSPF